MFIFYIEGGSKPMKRLLYDAQQDKTTNTTSLHQLVKDFKERLKAWGRERNICDIYELMVIV